MVKYILPHIPLTNNWFAPPHNRTRFEVGAARKSHKIVPCAVFSFTTSVLPPHLFPKLSAVLIKYFTSHTILRFSSHFYHNYQLKGKYPPEYGVKTMLLMCGVSPFSVSVKLTDFLHTFQIINYLSPQRWERMILSSKLNSLFVWWIVPITNRAPSNSYYFTFHRPLLTSGTTDVWSNVSVYLRRYTNSCPPP